LKFYLKDHSLEEFNMIAINIVTDRFNRTKEFAQKLVPSVWYKIGSNPIYLFFRSAMSRLDLKR
jgi:hypothetical protein